VLTSPALLGPSGGMADALASGASVLRDVGVQVPPRTLRVFDDSARVLLRKLGCGGFLRLKLGFWTVLVGAVEPGECRRRRYINE